MASGSNNKKTLLYICTAIRMPIMGTVNRQQQFRVNRQTVDRHRKSPPPKSGVCCSVSFETKSAICIAGISRNPKKVDPKLNSNKMFQFRIIYFLIAIVFVLFITSLICAIIQPRTKNSAHETIQNDPFPGRFDLITSLPGLKANLNYTQYSGYLNSIGGAQIFYWFFQSQSCDSLNDPIIVWLQGGPGCSSLYGAFSEIGPLHMNLNGSLSLNEYSWNTNANLLFLETPIGVGFSSYKPRPEPFLINDQNTADFTFFALESFFLKFPFLSQNSVYIAGESYAARYVTYLAKMLLEQKSLPTMGNFKGIAFSSGFLLDEVSQEPAKCHFLKLHGIPGFSFDPVPNSQKVWLYNIHKQCRDEYFPKSTMYFINYTDFHEPAKQPEILQPECGPEKQLVSWLNTNEVKKAIHVKNCGITWNLCPLNKPFWYKTESQSLVPTVRDLVTAGIKVLIFNGDADFVSTFVGAKWFADSLGFKLTSKDEYLYFKYQIAGMVYRYQKNVTFVQIRNAGHMAPADQPGPTFEMLNKFLLN